MTWEPAGCRSLGKLEALKNGDRHLEYSEPVPIFGVPHGDRLMRPRPAATCLKLLLACALPCAVCLLPCLGQQIHRNGFEGRNPSWVRANADAPFDETIHQMTDQVAHDGQRAEYLQIKAGQGTYLYYQYPVGRAPVSEELNASVWVKASRPGVQLVARL